MKGRFDLVAIGGGTAGLIATLGVAGIGGRAALIEAERPGGDCLWTGCVPSKALLATASAARTIRTADRFGLSASLAPVDFGRVMQVVRDRQATIEPPDSPERLRAHGVEVIEGRGRFIGPGMIDVDGRRVSYRTALIATGSKPTIPPIEGLADAQPLTSDTIWGLEAVPDRLAVLGGGAIGCELGQAFGRLGSQVTIIEAQPTLLPRESPAVGEYLARCLKEEGVAVHTGAAVRSVSVGAAGSVLHLDNGASVDFDRVLVATGRRPNTEALGLDRVGVETDRRGHVIVDDRLATTGDHIYAAGDVTDTMPFTHVAAHQARIVITNALFGTRRRLNYDRIPWVTFTDPEVARVGIDATAAHRRWGSRAIIQTFEYAHLDRAITDGTDRGWVELVADPQRRLVGATVIGKSAGETIAELTAWISSGAKVDGISTAVHAYPTYAEGAARAADEVLRRRVFDPRLTRVTGAALSVLRRVDRPRS